MKKLIPAFALLLVSAVLMSTASFAWFSMNTTVTASNMQIRAVAEQGILINEVATATDTNWDNLATANQAGTGTLAPLSMLYPSSTADGSTWFHAASTKSASSASATSSANSGDLVGDYETLTGLTAITAQQAAASAGSQAKFDTMGKTATSTAGYYVHYEYYLKSSGDAIDLTGTGTGTQKLTIKSVSAAATANNGGGGASGSTNLNKSVRVGIKVNSTFYVYAPLADSLSTYYVGTAHTAVTPIGASTETATDLTSIPAANAAGTKVDVYIWYEGEDANCKTDNATAAILDNIKIDITFALKTEA